MSELQRGAESVRVNMQLSSQSGGLVDALIRRCCRLGRYRPNQSSTWFHERAEPAELNGFLSTPRTAPTLAIAAWGPLLF
jgi:hypothetical protein